MSGYAKDSFVNKRVICHFKSRPTTMKKNTFFLIATLIICSNNLFGQTDNNKFDPLLNKVKNWFNAWDLVY